MIKMKLTTKHGDVEVHEETVARMADRLHRLKGEGRRASYVAKAKKRIEAGPVRHTDAATVLAAGG
jgi:hypothetical protein